MANRRNFNWGHVVWKPCSGLENIDSRRVHCKGTGSIAAFTRVPLELRDTDAVFCTVTTGAVHALVLPGDDKDFYNILKVTERLMSSPVLEVGDTIDCPRGSGIAFYNKFAQTSTIDFQLYYPD